LSIVPNTAPPMITSPITTSPITPSQLLAGWDTDLNIAQRFRQVAAWGPDKTALVCGEVTLSYAELAQRVSAAVDALVQAGVAPGDHLGVALHNDVPFVVLMLAAAELGAVLAPVSPALSAEALGSVFSAAGVKHVVALGAVVAELIPSSSPSATRSCGPGRPASCTVSPPPT